MADGIVTLKERHRRKMERMERAIVEIDAALTAYAREHGGRFIRYGSTAKGRMMQHSDVDIIADFPDEASLAAASFAESLCYDKNMKPDVSASAYVSDRFKSKVVEEAVVLS